MSTQEYVLSFTAEEIDEKLGKIDGLADKSELPTKISELTNDAGFITNQTETDPTVPAWAKEPAKPTYTASEVGADASGTASSLISTHNSDATAHVDIRAELAMMDDEHWLINDKITTLSNNKLNASELPEAVNAALAQAKDSGEFDGDPGAPGVTPHIGSNGNWYIGSADTGVKAQGKDGTSVTVKSVSESTADGGSNVVTFSDGKALTVKNGERGSAGKTPIRGVDYYTEADKAEFSEYIASELAKRGQLKPEFANSIEECTDTTMLYVLPDGYIYAHMLTEVEVGGYTNLVGPDESGFQSGYRMKSVSAEPVTTSEANSFVSNAFPCKQGDILRIRGVGISSKNSATAQQFMVVPVDSSGAVVTNHGFALGEPLYNSTQQMFTTWKQSWDAIETAEDGTITWTYAINNGGTQAASMNLSEPTAAVRLAGVATNGYDNIIVTVNEEIIEPTVEKKYTWTNTGHTFVPADYENRIIGLEVFAEDVKQTVKSQGERISEVEEEVEKLKQTGGFADYGIFDYAYIKGGELIANALNVTGNSHGHYTGVKMDGNVKRIMCKAKLSANSSAVLISTKLGSSVIANITRGSIHLIFSLSGCAVGIYDGGSSPLRNVVQYGCPTAENTEVSFGYALDEATNTLTVHLPDGTTKTVTDNAFSAVNGQYAIWEHYCSNDSDGFKCCRYTKLWCEDADGNILDDDLKRLDGAIGVAPTGQVYRQFRTGHQTNRDFV